MTSTLEIHKRGTPFKTADMLEPSSSKSKARARNARAQFNTPEQILSWSKSIGDYDWLIGQQQLNHRSYLVKDHIKEGHRWQPQTLSSIAPTTLTCLASGTVVTSSDSVVWTKLSTTTETLAPLSRLPHWGVNRSVSSLNSGDQKHSSFAGTTHPW